MNETTGMNENPLAILPEVLLAAGAVLALLLGSWLPRHRQWPARLTAASAAAGGIAAAAVQAAADSPTTAFGGAFAIDPVTTAARVVILAATLLLIALAAAPARGHPRESEYYVLLQLAALGALMLAGANDLLLLAAAYLLAGVPSYALAAFAKNGPGTEAALKFYVLGALLGVLMLAGITVLHAAGRATAYGTLRAGLPQAPEALVAAGLVALLAGLLFKAGAVPGHFWVPDAVQGSTPQVAALLTTLPKAGALAALYRLATEPLAGTTVPWPGLLAVLAAASMTLGNLAAFFQQDVTRLLAYSTISQVGYLLMPIAVAGRSGLAQQALLYYLAAYALTNLGAFAVVCALPRARAPADYRGLARTRPALAASLAVCLLGLVGTPPTAVFLGKLEAFGAAIDGGYAWLAVVAAANTVASLFYYLRWLAPALAPAAPPRHTPIAAPEPAAAVAACAAAGGSLLLGVLGGPLLALLDGPAS
ncbi:proton-conducting transporter membrane subunit [Streptomyces sp. DSM 44917]|uniref:NADH-quinone oxidoreductase subunit N n=1 Tax=Streptomyces boetiae TaxID=3075541 RepID=A0ABU2L4M5_9ACTN|nr:proton-conducting transporter membrane subunit [Streptomyces sp. DSM 44917]MDT0306512.1 proton-conducting transporter membrane subunit [Streptomyces sp. DSM 44917]